MRKISNTTREALADQKRQSVVETRKKLDAALSRLINGKNQVLLMGVKLNAASVAKEAGVDRATLYRFHQPILDKIRLLQGKSSNIASPHGNVASAKESKIKEYLHLAEEAQHQVTALARINHRLNVRIEELEELLLVRDSTIFDLMERLNKTSFTTGVTRLRPRI